MDVPGPDGRGLTDEVIAGLLLSVIFAGQHTSAVMGAWTGILLLEHPEFLPPILAEQEAVLGSGEMTIDRLRHLVALERGIKEAERMHPPLIMLMRRVGRDLAVRRLGDAGRRPGEVSPRPRIGWPTCSASPIATIPIGLRPRAKRIGARGTG